MVKNPDEDQPRKRGSGSASIYESLRRDILDLSLEPGSPLDESALSLQFSMSRTPVREALVRLVAEGLVTTLPNRNTIVANINLQDMRSYFDALMLMYRVTARGAALSRSDEQVREMRDSQQAFKQSAQAEDAMAMIDSNRDFHMMIAQAAGNQYYLDLFARLLDQGRRILRLYYRSYQDRLPQAHIGEHDEIIDAIEARDAERADQIASQHALQIVRQIQSVLEPEVGKEIKL